MVDDRRVDNVTVGVEGRVRLDSVSGGLSREWPSVGALASDYLRYARLSSEDKQADDMAAWVSVIDLVSEPAWEGAVNLIDELLQRATENEILEIAAGPLEELVVPQGQGPRFIESIELRARSDRRWTQAVSGVWLDRDSSADVNRRLAVFGARHADGSMPQ